MLPRWLGPLVGTLMGLVTVGVITWMLGVKAAVWHTSPTGFWVF
jgi:hypothetical protein